MPIPKPKQNESRKDFMQRCMNDTVMINEYRDANQRVAVCSTQFKNKQQKVFLFINICLYLYYINTKTKQNIMKNKKFYWNEDTLSHFKLTSSYQSKDETMAQIYEFVQDCCDIEDGETEEDLAIDLIEQVYS